MSGTLKILHIVAGRGADLNSFLKSNYAKKNNNNYIL